MFVGVMSFAACEDKSGLDNWFDKPAEKNTLELTIGQGATVTEDGQQLVEVGPDSQWDNLVFEWTEAEPPTSDYKIANYIIKINVVGGDGADYSTGFLSADARSYTVRKRDIYKHMYANWAYRFNAPTDMVATIYANIEGGQFYYKPVITKMNFQLQPTEITARKFYLWGKANPSEEPIEITMVQPDMFYQIGNVLDGGKKCILNPESEFVISLSRESMYPGFVLGDKVEETIAGTQIEVEDGFQMIYVENEAQAAGKAKFMTKEANHSEAHGEHNNYWISIENDDESAVPSAKIYFGRHSTQYAWIVGDAVNGEWKHVQMNWHYKAPEMFYREGHWYDITTTPNNQGAIKIHAANNWNDPSWRPITHGTNPADPNSDRRVTSNSSGDKKWVLPANTDGYYRFELHAPAMTMDFVKLKTE